MAELTLKEAVEKTMKDNGWTTATEVAERAQSSPLTVTKILDGSDRLNLLLRADQDGNNQVGLGCLDSP